MIKRLSTTTKITFWYVISLMVISMLFIGVLVLAGNVRATDLAQTRLMDAVNNASEEIVISGDEVTYTSQIDFYENGVYLTIYDSNGVMVEGRKPFELTAITMLTDGKITKVIYDDDEIWYVYDKMFEANGETFWLRGMVEDFGEEGTFGFILKMAIIALPGFILLAAIGGFLITKRALRPVKELNATVESIANDGNLSRRVEVRGGSKRDEITRLAGNFNRMFDRVEGSVAQEKKFTSDVAHELRTPLAVVVSQSEYALENSDYSGQALQTINREGRRMTNLVNRLLTLARSDSGRLVLEKETFSLSEVMESLCEQQQALGAESDVVIERSIRENISVTGDEDMIIRIVLNLIDNAAKYGRSDDGTCRMNVSLEATDGMAIIRVADKGAGIADEDVPNVWNRFYRASKSRNDGGAGLGLLMVKALTEAHGGTVSATNGTDGGAVFEIKIPMV